MKQNLGTTDRILRLVTAVIIGILLIAGQINGAMAIVLGILAVIFLLTSLVSFCPLYVPLKISTKKETKA